MLSRFVSFINDMGMKKKLLLAFLLVTLLPIMMVGGYLTFKMRTMAYENALSQSSINVERVKKRTEEVIGVSHDIAFRLINDTRLKRLAVHHYETTYDVVKAYREYSDMREYLSLYNEISGIRLYTTNMTLLNNWELLNPSPEILASDWYQQANENDYSSSWVYVEDERDGRKYLSLTRKLELEGAARTGVLVINVNHLMLNSILNQETFETMIVDDQNNIIAANRQGMTGKTLTDIAFDTNLLDKGKGSHQSLVNGAPSTVVIEELMPPSSRNGLRVISIFKNESILLEANRAIRLSITVILVSAAISFLLIWSFSSLSSKRMMRLSKHINRFGTGEFNTLAKIDGRDEIGQLSRQFNLMVRSINDLLLQVQQSNERNSLLEKRQSEIRFKMLASQINPHFLFNALESIRMEAHMQGQHEIARVVQLLGKLMRSNLEVGRTHISLRNEFEIIRSYLDIQKFRYEDRLTYQLLVDPGLEDMLLPPLLVQPLVENAIVHGLDNKLDGTLLTVRVEKQGDLAVFRISDNGQGMSQETLERVREGLLKQEDDEEQRIGLRNVHDRLILSYRETHGLHIDSAPGKGTAVQFTIPLGGGQG